MNALKEKPPSRAYINESSKEMLKRMLIDNPAKLPVVNSRNRLKGIIALKDHACTIEEILCTFMHTICTITLNHHVSAVGVGDGLPA